MSAGTIILNPGATATGKSTRSNAWRAKDRARRVVFDEAQSRDWCEALLLAEAGQDVMLNVLTRDSATIIRMIEEEDYA